MTLQSPQPSPQPPTKGTRVAIVWKKICVLGEKWYPSFFGTLAVAVALGVRWKFPEVKLPSDLSQLFSSTMDIGAIAIGFLATAKTVLLSIQGSPAVEKMRGSGLYEGLLRYILTAIRAAFVLAAYSLVTVFLEKVLKDSPIAWQGVVVAWLYLVVMAGLACYRVIDVFFTILSPDDVGTLVPHEHNHSQGPLKVVAPPRKEPNQGNSPP